MRNGVFRKISTYRDVKISYTHSSSNKPLHTDPGTPKFDNKFHVTIILLCGKYQKLTINFIFPVPDASVPAVLICSDKSAAGMINSARETR